MSCLVLIRSLEWDTRRMQGMEYSRNTDASDADRARASVCIVGAGPAGLLLGLLLAKRGVDVIVLEGHQTFDREFRGEVLQPSTAHLLDELGLLQYILAQPHSTLTEGRMRFKGQTLGD